MTHRIKLPLTFCIVMLSVGSTMVNAQVDFFSNSAIGPYTSYPFVASSGRDLSLVGYTGDTSNYQMYAVLLLENGVWRVNSSLANGFVFSREALVRDIEYSANNNITIGGEGMLLRKLSGQDQWIQYQTSNLDTVRGVSSIYETDDGVYLTSESAKVLRVDTVNGVVVQTARMFFELFKITQNGLMLLERATEERPRVALSNLTQSGNAVYTAVRMNSTNDRRHLIRIQGENVDYIDMGVDVPLNSTPRISTYPDGSLCLIYPSSVFEKALFVRWHPMKGLVTSKQINEPVSVWAGMVIEENVIIAANGVSTLWLFDGERSRKVSVDDLVGNATQTVYFTFDITSYQGKVCITTEDGLYLVDKQLLLNLLTSVDVLAGTKGLVTYPNPVDGTHFYIQLPNELWSFRGVTDLVGNEIYCQTSRQNSQIRVDVSGFSPGMYCVGVGLGSQIASTIFIVTE